MSSSGFNPLQNKLSEENKVSLTQSFLKYLVHLNSKAKKVPQKFDSCPDSYDVDVLPAAIKIKKQAVETLIKAQNEDIERFSEVFGRYEPVWIKPSDWNPATGMGMKYTEGALFALQIRKIVPEISENFGFLVGQAKCALISFLEARNQSKENNPPQDNEAKTSDDEKALYDACHASFKNLYDNSKDYSEKIEIFVKYQTKMAELINKVSAKNKGFFAKVTSTLRNPPESQLLLDINAICDKHAMLNQKIEAKNV